MFALRVFAVAAAWGLSGSNAAPQGNFTSVPAPTLTETTAIASPSPSVNPNGTLPSQVPPVPQAWCPSQIFCAGSLLQTINLANLFVDQKTIVDKPTAFSAQRVLSDFNAFSGNGTGNITTSAVLNFVNTDFSGEGRELTALSIANFSVNPAFLSNVSDPIVRSWSKVVHGYWTSLIRGTNQSTLCTDPNVCESSLIPLNHTFVVPGGRFREQYYWDSYWIVLGLLESELYSNVNDTLQNFMDEIERFGFIPNGGRIYYLNRSQPPLFIHMLDAYLEKTNDTAILTRALPLAEAELTWFRTNRTISVKSAYTNTTHQVARYAVTNSAPRPESYLQDYNTANEPSAALNETQRSQLYAELASGAETGWDYSSRWMRQVLPGTAGLRSLAVTTTIPVDLNAILYRNHIILGNLYLTRNKVLSDNHFAEAASLRAAVLDLFWDKSKLAFYDYNVTSNSRNSIFTAAHFYPLWAGIVPDELYQSKENAFGYASSLNLIANRYNGTVPATFINTTGQQWDFPNAWPPHTYIALKALRALPANVSSGAFPQPASNASSFSLIPANQLNLTEAELPPQIISTSSNASATGAAADVSKLNGTVVNGGNASTANEGWRDALERQIANRYIVSAYCSWRASGGSLNDSGVVVPRLSSAELNITGSINGTGTMYEKYSVEDIDSSGRGGEYAVQAGFGWTNGVALYIASQYGQKLASPQCPAVGIAAPGGGGSGAATHVTMRGSEVVLVALLAAVLLL